MFGKGKEEEEDNSSYLDPENPHLFTDSEEDEVELESRTIVNIRRNEGDVNASQNGEVVINTAGIGTLGLGQAPSVTVQITNHYHGTNVHVSAPDGFSQIPDSSKDNELGKLLTVLTMVLGNFAGQSARKEHVSEVREGQ